MPTIVSCKSLDGIMLGFIQCERCPWMDQQYPNLIELCHRGKLCCTPTCVHTPGRPECCESLLDLSIHRPYFASLLSRCACDLASRLNKAKKTGSGQAVGQLMALLYNSQACKAQETTFKHCLTHESSRYMAALQHKACPVAFTQKCTT